MPAQGKTMLRANGSGYLTVYSKDADVTLALFFSNPSIGKNKIHMHVLTGRVQAPHEDLYNIWDKEISSHYDQEVAVTMPVADKVFQCVYKNYASEGIFHGGPAKGYYKLASTIAEDTPLSG